MHKLERLILKIKAPAVLQEMDDIYDDMNKSVGVGIEAKVGRRLYHECLAAVGEAHVDDITERLFGIKKGHCRGDEWKTAKGRVNAWLNSNDVRRAVKGSVEKVAGKPAVWKLTKSAAEAEAARRAKFEKAEVGVNTQVAASKSAATATKV